MSTNEPLSYTALHYQRSHVFHSWRRMRRAAQEALTKTAVQRYHPILTKEATILASTLLSNPENRDQHFQRTVASTMLSILYGLPTLTSKDNNAVQDISRAINSSLRAATGTALVEFFPWMTYIPQRSRLFPQLKGCILHLDAGLRSGRGKLLNNLPSVPRGFFDYSIVSRRILYVPLSECVNRGHPDCNKSHRQA